MDQMRIISDKSCSKQETDFFRYFDTVDIVDVPTEQWERYIVKDLDKRYGKDDAE